VLRIIITGAEGQVGKNLANVAIAFDFEILPMPRSRLDITNLASIKAMFALLKPDLVINSAAYTAVDKAETDMCSAFAINETGCANLAEMCSSHDIPLFHISTDYVFDGSFDKEYVESCPVSPTGVYACSKEAGERQIRKHLKKHIILRTSWVFSAEGANFPRTILRLSQERSLLRVVDDQMGGPTSARAVASVLLTIAQQYESNRNIPWGTFHFAQLPYVSWFEFAMVILEKGKEAGLVSNDVHIAPCPSEEYVTSAVRPKNSRLCSEKLYHAFGIREHSWYEDLDVFIEDIG
jgi:dTDP-4-dehydrorhamnose reductase